MKAVKLIIIKLMMTDLVGDLVMVPAGKDNHLAMVEVVNIEYFQEEMYHCPL